MFFGRALPADQHVLSDRALQGLFPEQQARGVLRYRALYQVAKASGESCQFPVCGRYQRLNLAAHYPRQHGTASATGDGDQQWITVDYGRKNKRTQLRRIDHVYLDGLAHGIAKHLFVHRLVGRGRHHQSPAVQIRLAVIPLLPHTGVFSQ